MKMWCKKEQKCKLYTLEKFEVNAKIARQVIDFAGLSDIVEVKINFSFYLRYF